MEHPPCPFSLVLISWNDDIHLNVQVKKGTALTEILIRIFWYNINETNFLLCKQRATESSPASNSGNDHNRWPQKSNIPVEPTGQPNSKHCSFFVQRTSLRSHKKETRMRSQLMQYVLKVFKTSIVLKYI